MSNSQILLWVKTYTSKNCLRVTFFPRIVAGLSVLILVVLLCACGENTFYTSLKVFPADSKSTGTITLKKNIFHQDEEILTSFKSNKSIRILSHNINKNREILYFQSTENPGEVVVSTNKGKYIILQFYKIAGDSDNDGFPDKAELLTAHDKQAFIHWFVRIAESQFLKSNYSWNKKQRDCAGLIRYAYREALKKHDENWLKQSGIIIDKNLPDISSFNFPQVPVLGKKVFKTKKGPAFDLKTFGHFADAEKLLTCNSKFISRDLKDARQGDILFFQYEHKGALLYHSMIVAQAYGPGIIVMYHTGTDNIIKRVPVSYLAQSNNFNPQQWNPRFLGVYRFHILVN